MTSTSSGGRRPDSQQLVRQWALLRLLADTTSGYSVKELAEQLGTSKATIERDLATLEHDFAVVEETVGKQKKLYRIDHKIRALETITFGTTELLAIYAAHAAMANARGTPLDEDLRAVIAKIRGFLSPRHNGGLDAISRVFVTHARGYVDYTSQHEQIDLLADAIRRNLERWRLVTHAMPDFRRTLLWRPIATRRGNEAREVRVGAAWRTNPVRLQSASTRCASSSR